MSSRHSALIPPGFPKSESPSYHSQDSTISLQWRATTFAKCLCKPDYRYATLGFDMLEKIKPKNNDSLHPTDNSNVWNPQSLKIFFNTRKHVHLLCHLYSLLCIRMHDIKPKLIPLFWAQTRCVYATWKASSWSPLRSQDQSWLPSVGGGCMLPPATSCVHSLWLKNNNTK